MQPNPDQIAHLTARGYNPVARLRPRCAREIGSSPWSIGCETVDRGYVDFAQVGPHLGELGATQVRLQAGWARCEPVPGAPYRWEWLDAAVDGSLAQGVRPWLEACYGNPAYPGGGGIGLAGGVPSSPAALSAWDAWVAALVERYGDRVSTWEIWNEPHLHVNGTWANQPESFADFHIRTATIIRARQPEARIVGLALGSNDGIYPSRLLRRLVEQGGAGLLDELSFHFYPDNPDHDFAAAEDLLRLVRRLGISATLRQGETGSPSDTQRFMALGHLDWSERRQAAWNLRRLLAHHVRGIPMNLFQLSDMHYTRRDGALFAGYNSKGLLRVRPDMTVAYRKQAYFAAQHVFSLFDHRFPLAALPVLPARANGLPAAHRWRSGDGRTMLGWWQAGTAPELATPEPTAIGLEPEPLRDPVLVDLCSGTVFSPPAAVAAGEAEAWQRLPLADVPLLLAERSLLHLRELP